MVTGTDRMCVFVRSQSFRSFKVKFGPGGIDKIVIFNICLLPFTGRVGIFNGNKSSVTGGIPFRMQLQRFGLFELYAPPFVERSQFKAYLVNAHLADTHPDI